VKGMKLRLLLMGGIMSALSLILFATRGYSVDYVGFPGVGWYTS